jgi:hypothetical protein
LEKVLASLLASWPAEAPKGYAQRSREIEFAGRL